MYRILMLAVGLCVSVMAQADAYGVFEMPGQTRTEVYYQDDDHIRINAGQDGYMLVSGGKVYSVMNQGGKKVAMDMSQMGKAMAQFSQGNNSSDDNAPEDVEIRKTGKTETVAGYEGHVHEVSINGRTLEVVLSDNPGLWQPPRGFSRACSASGRCWTRRIPEVPGRCLRIWMKPATAVSSARRMALPWLRRRKWTSRTASTSCRPTWI